MDKKGFFTMHPLVFLIVGIIAGAVLGLYLASIGIQVFK